jgi:acyl-coenzyme A thioesterase PaaI-like protein
MSDSPRNKQELAVQRLNQSARRLLHQVRATTAPPECLEEATRALDRVSEILEPFAHPGPFAQASLDGTTDLGSDFGDLISLMPYSPIIGRLNPISPPLDFAVEGGVVRARARFPATFAGPTQCVHGGMVAASFDELLAGVNVANELGAMTGTLTIRYRRPTPLFEEVQMEGHCTGSEGRKVFAHGEMLAGGQVTAEAEGVFVIPRG